MRVLIVLGMLALLAGCSDRETCAAAVRDAFPGQTMTVVEVDQSMIVLPSEEQGQVFKCKYGAVDPAPVTVVWPQFTVEPFPAEKKGP